MDINSLYQINPALAAYAAGGQIYDQEQSNALDQRTKDLANIFAEANNPQRLQQQDLQTQGAQAELPGKRATSDKLMAEAGAMQDPAYLASKLAGYNKDINNNAEDATQLNAAKWARTAQLLSNFSNPVDQANIVNKLALQSGIPQEQVDAFISKNIRDLPGAIKAYASQVVKTNPSTAAKLDELSQGASSHLAVAQEQGKNALAVEQARIAAGKYNRTKALSLDQAIDNAKSARERYQKLQDAASVAEQGGDVEAANNYRARAEVVRPQAEAELRAQARPGTANLEALGVKANPDVSIAPRDKGPAVGTIQQGYRFKGGNPADKANWEKTAP